MFTSKSSDVSFNSQRKTDTNLVRFNSSSNISVASNERSGEGRVTGLQNGSSSHVENHLSSMTAPTVSVISSSMEIFGSAESNDPLTMNKIDSATNTGSSYSVSANLAAPSFISELNMHVKMPAQFVAATKSEKVCIKPKSMKRAIKTDDEAMKKNQKKQKQSIEATVEKATHSVDHSAAEKHSLDMSFERAAVVAALTSLYGPTSGNLNSKLPTNTNISTLEGKTSPMPLPNQLKNSDGQPTLKMALPSIGDTMVDETMKIKSLNCTQADVHVAAAHPLVSSLREPEGKMLEGIEIISAVKAGPYLSKKKLPKNDDAPANSRKSSITQYPTQYDVLLGRGKSNKNHPGNVWFQGTFIFCYTFKCPVINSNRKISSYLVMPI